jgi:hypothetical protein
MFHLLSFSLSLSCLVVPCSPFPRLLFIEALSLSLSLLCCLSRGREAEGVWLSEYVTEFVRAEFALKSEALLHNYTTPFQSVQLADTVQFGKVNTKGQKPKKTRKTRQERLTRERRQERRQGKTREKTRPDKVKTKGLLPLSCLCLVCLVCLCRILSCRVVLSSPCLSALARREQGS